MDEAPALSSLHDIVEPPPISFWPLATGWWILLAVLFVGALVLFWKLWVYRLQNAYRKEALQILAQAETPAEVVAVLRRCVRVWRSAPEMNALSETEWFDLLAKTGEASVPNALTENWSQALYGTTPVENLSQWKSFASQWIQKHQPEETP
ncbi:DUF4381 domain-containing protein [Kiritimatiellota bacterium B12222]|nr:DUF4381 domain-containing protein [Kiritimatiellota bacterium B12222]